MTVPPFSSLWPLHIGGTARNGGWLLLGFARRSGPFGTGVLKRHTYIPFGPFLSLGALISLLYREEVVYFAFVVWPGFLRSLTS